ncbi:hypothetical protein QBC46DRAFT_390117 [Diplogelasinospora grovesii]|uniref:Structure-specific endonuclease subunit SLX4 n=1 Tax=Diplogelasinospora grovesii TaxID=303347 RepID=A0AAN6N3L7_9PEZI|nr:hypothetical protein QBC46DRAFT_390117 [Diplogelasinospora grovesii]
MIASSPSEKPRRKVKGTKDVATHGQTKLPKGKVTKSVAKDKPTKKKAEIVSRHFVDDETPPNAISKPEPVTVNDPVALEPALRRRIDWTPPPEIMPPLPQMDSSVVREVSSQTQGASLTTGDTSRDLFKNLLDTYGRKPDDPEASERSISELTTDVLGKRKLIEMVATTTNKPKTPEVSPAKSKAPKKKPRTITDLATAAYRLPDESDVSVSTGNSKTESLLEYFAVSDGQAGPSGKQTGAKTVNAKKGANSKKPSKKKAEPRKQILLSPTSALRQVSRQDFVFGTASQLATEEDPELLRALHKAMTASNQDLDDPFVSPSPVTSNLAVQRSAGRKLWAAGARDEGGDLLDLAVVDLTESPAFPRDYSLPVILREDATADAQSPIAHKSPVEIPSSDDEALFGTKFVDVDSLVKAKPNLTQRKDESNVLNLSHDALETNQAGPVDDVDFGPPPSNQEQYKLIEEIQSQSQSPLSNSPKQPVDGPPRPKFELYTDAQLAREIASYGFKAVKRRTAMIALLDQCWSSKNPTPAPGTRPTNHASMSTASSATAVAPNPAASAPAAPVAKPRGRPRKSSEQAAATAPPDADAPQVAQAVKKPRGRPKKDAAGTAAPPTRNAPRVTKATKTKAAAATAKSAPDPPPLAPQVVVAPSPRRRGKAKAVAPEPVTVLEIADSDSDSDCSLSSLSDMDGLFSSDAEQAVDVSMSTSIGEDREMSLVSMDPTDQQTVMFSCITKAVTTAPPATDPLHPSWHEKMLMYDPIILEDLAAWLNAGRLDTVGYDGEVSPFDVKKWCESKSICCLWRNNLHGVARKRL